MALKTKPPTRQQKLLKVLHSSIYPLCLHQSQQFFVVGMSLLSMFSEPVYVTCNMQLPIGITFITISFHN